jgi:hypothetical protein
VDIQPLAHFETHVVFLRIITVSAFLASSSFLMAVP